MKSITFIRVAAVAAISLFLSLAPGCGGGGGDGGVAPAPPAPASIVYNGITTQTVVTAANAEDLATAALGAGEFGLASAAKVEGTSAYPRYLKLVDILRRSTENIELTSTSQPVAGAIVPVSGTRYGNCGGSASLTGTLDDQTGDTSGTMTFSNYCSNGITMNGVVSYSGIYDLVNDEFDVFSMTTSNLGATDGVSSFAIGGTITYDYRNVPIVVTMDMMLQDGASGKVYWADGYLINIWDYAGYTDYSMTGQSYHPDYGYVDVTTPTLFRIYDTDDYPSQGVLEIVGDIGTGGGNTRARLTALTNTTYQVIADTNGDGDFTDPGDYDSGTLNW
jgi:hypothetical protein